MSLTKMTCGTSTTTDLISNVNGLIGGVVNQPTLFAAIGDSRNANSIQNQTSGGVLRYNNTNQGSLSWLGFISRQGIAVPYQYNKAVSGATTSEILGQVEDILSIDALPSFCFINGFTNDTVISEDDVNNSLSNILAAATKLRDNGITPIIETDTPRSTSTSSADFRMFSTMFNRKLRSACVSMGFILADHEDLYTDSSGEPVTGYNVADGIHQSSTGALIRALKLKSAIESKLTTVKRNITSPLDLFNATKNQNGNLQGNGCMLGSSGTSLGTGASGVVADGWQNRVVSGTMTAVASKESPRLDGITGDYQVITLNATTDSSYRFSRDITTTGKLSAGDIVKAMADMSITSLSGVVDYIRLNIFDFDGTSIGSSSLGMRDAFLTGLNPMPQVPLTGKNSGETIISSLNGTISTEDIVIGQGITSTTLIVRLEVFLKAGSSLTLKFGGCSVSKQNAA